MAYILKLSPTHFLANIRHQHRYNLHFSLNERFDDADQNDFDWNQFDLPKEKTSEEIEVLDNIFFEQFLKHNFFKEEIRRLEMEGDFEAGAKLRQQLRDVRRAEKKAAEEAATKAAANAEQGCEPLP